MKGLFVRRLQRSANVVSSRGIWLYPLVLILLGSQICAQAQIDPEHRRLIQLGYNQPLEGRGPIAAYGFYYYNKPSFYSTNLTLRLAVAPIYVDSELGFSKLLGANTDVAIGLAGGGFADSYSEVRQGVYRREESFTGHGGEVSASVYHRFRPDWLVPLWGILRAGVHQSYYEADRETSGLFRMPDDRTSAIVRTGLRWGGREPTLTTPLAMELSVWYEGQFRTDSAAYGFMGDRQSESDSHLFWGRALLKYTFDPSYQEIEFSLTTGASIDPDRFSAYRLGGLLPFASEFPLNIPGYYFHELSARQFALLNGQYSFPLEATKRWNFTLFAASGAAQYLAGLEQPGRWHSGAGGGITYYSPAAAWFVTLIYAHGFDAIRTQGRGANQIGLLFQYDFGARKQAHPRRFQPGVSPYRSRGGERLIFD